MPTRRLAHQKQQINSQTTSLEPSHVMRIWTFGACWFFWSISAHAIVSSLTTHSLDRYPPPQCYLLAFDLSHVACPILCYSLLWISVIWESDSMQFEIVLIQWHTSLDPICVDLALNLRSSLSWEIELLGTSEMRNKNGLIGLIGLIGYIMTGRAGPTLLGFFYILGWPLFHIVLLTLLALHYGVDSRGKQSFLLFYSTPLLFPFFLFFRLSWFFVLCPSFLPSQSTLSHLFYLSF